jgi:hypothetical protein
VLTNGHDRPALGSRWGQRDQPSSANLSQTSSGAREVREGGLTGVQMLPSAGTPEHEVMDCLTQSVPKATSRDQSGDLPWLAHIVRGLKRARVGPGGTVSQPAPGFPSRSPPPERCSARSRSWCSRPTTPGPRFPVTPPAGWATDDGCGHLGRAASGHQRDGRASESPPVIRAPRAQ